MSSGMLNRGDVIWLVGEILQADIQIRGGNKDRYVAGRRVALAATACRLLRIARPGLDRYMTWVSEQVESRGRRIGDLEEPGAWIRKNPA
ncbi:hypothetical protein SEA_YARA_47 [Streptomyces phage Yara]|nr:hypothetical protein SEA_YARA_47 [Streptomyces phage Yara]